MNQNTEPKYKVIHFNFIFRHNCADSFYNYDLKLSWCCRTFLQFLIFFYLLHVKFLDMENLKAVGYTAYA
jgi:hypothetical protein